MHEENIYSTFIFVSSLFCILLSLFFLVNKYAV